MNIVLNFALIPLWKENAAAFTTILAEGVAFFGCRYWGKKYVSLNGIGKTLGKVLAGCAAIVVVWWPLQMLVSNAFLNAICTFVFAALAYFAVETLLGNRAIISVMCGLHQRFRKN